MQLLVATTNRHKLEEINQYLINEPIELKSLLDFPGYPEVVEDGVTFEENALKKARIYFDYTGLVTLADDSGLEVDALDGQPGVMSARFAGPGADSRMLCEKILRLMADIQDPLRSARFRCVMVLVGPDVVEVREGQVEGIVGYEMRGTLGFGYDPIFYYPPLNQTFAQIDMESKNLLSHRGKALIEIKSCLKKIRQ